MFLDALRTTSELLDGVLTHLRSYRRYGFDAAVACAAVWVLLRWIHKSRQQHRTTRLRGPPSEGFLYGAGERTLGTEGLGTIYEALAQEYGAAYAVPWALGSKRIILCDPKAIAHFFSKDTWSYVQTPFNKNSMAWLFGKGLLWADGEDHKRQRRSLTPAFSVAAIRQLTSIFYDSAYKVKGAWDVLIESSGGDSALIDVQNWLNRISLDLIGLAGFSHSFGALEGHQSPVAEIFDAFGEIPRSAALNKVIPLLGPVLPFLAWVPTPLTRLSKKFDVAMAEISSVLLARTQKELEMGVVGGKEERSIIGLLIKGANSDSELHLTKDEVVAQMKLLLVAGYETSSISLTWTLLELSRNPDMQTRLRNELLECGVDPTYDQLIDGLPYLDAVVHEILRLHPPVIDFTRLAAEDDVIPLSEQVRTETGELVDSLTIAKGTVISISTESINRSAAIWGEDAKMFRPSRWLEDGHGRNGMPAKAKEIQGYRHLLTFSDGARICLGRNFAVTEIKMVLTVLVKNFVFELRDDVDSKIEMGIGLLPRPKIVGEVGCRLPLRVRPYVA